MTDDGEERAKAAGGAEGAGEREGATERIPAPTPEEVPELLGERSDYPVPFGEGGERGAERADEEPAPPRGTPAE